MITRRNSPSPLLFIKNKKASIAHTWKRSMNKDKIPLTFIKTPRSQAIYGS